MSEQVMNNLSSRKLWQLVNVDSNTPAYVKQWAQQELNKRHYRQY